MSTKKEYEAKPAHNPKPYQRQWAVWRGDWEVATCWSEPGAQYVGIEINPEYVDIINRRLAYEKQTVQVAVSQSNLCGLHVFNKQSEATG